MQAGTPTAGHAALVIDTNIVLDLWVFEDPAAATLRVQLGQSDMPWYATQAMRDELQRVLDYPAIALWLARALRKPQDVLAQWDAHTTLVAAAPEAPWRCKDADDQKFIDLTVQQRALLLSKDKAVLCLAKRLQASGVRIARTLDDATSIAASALPQSVSAGFH